MEIKVRGVYPSTKMGDELAIVNMETGSYVLLNEVGCVIWEKINESNYSLDSLVAEMLAEYEVDEVECRKSVGLFLEKLKACELVE